MKKSVLIIIGTLVLIGCSRWSVKLYPDLVETEKPLVARCKLLGMVNETADAGNPVPLAATENMILRVRERAGDLGASHIVWLHQTATSAAAEAYQCPLR